MLQLQEDDDAAACLGRLDTVSSWASPEARQPQFRLHSATFQQASQPPAAPPAVRRYLTLHRLCAHILRLDPSQMHPPPTSRVQWGCGGFAQIRLPLQLILFSPFPRRPPVPSPRADRRWSPPPSTSPTSRARSSSPGTTGATCPPTSPTSACLPRRTAPEPAAEGPHSTAGCLSALRVCVCVRRQVRALHPGAGGVGAAARLDGRGHHLRAHPGARREPAG